MFVFPLRFRTLLLTPFLCALLGAGANALQQPEKKPPAGKAVSTQAPTEPARPSVRRPPRGRLPAYFSAVVSQQQRTRIYEIQKLYNDKVATMRLQIQQLLGQRDKEVDDVLTPDQLAQVALKRQAAETRRQSRLQRRANPGNEER